MDETNGASDTPVVAAIDGAADNERTLKRMWLNLIQLEQVIEIALKLDELVPADVKSDVWPPNLQTAVLSKAFVTIAKTGLNLANVQKPPDTKEDKQKQQDDVPSPSCVDGSSESRTAGVPTPVNGASPSPIAPPAPETSGHPTLSSFALTHDKLPYPASHYAYPHGYPHHQLTSGQQPYPYTYHAPHTPGATPYNPACVPSSSKSPSKADEQDLPSYEEMLVQALIEYDDPSGTAPKQLFQWMASHYPLQANFRPSASQALQKAYKRGRLEKSKDGRYRLNAAWEGGSTSKRTTRRPQSFTQAATNPSPSSHPPATTYPPQYAMAYPGMAYPMKALSHSPPPPHESPFPKVPPEALSSATAELSADGESPHQAWEAAQSILQALNITSLLITDSAAGPSVTESPSHTTRRHAEAKAVVLSSSAGFAQKMPCAIAYPSAPLIAKDISIGLAFAKGGKLPPTGAPSCTKIIGEPPPMAALLPAASEFSLASSVPTTTDGTSSRTALQGALALLAAQLLDIANESDEPAASSALVTLSADMAGTSSGSAATFNHSFNVDPP